MHKELRPWLNHDTRVWSKSNLQQLDHMVDWETVTWLDHVCLISQASKCQSPSFYQSLWKQEWPIKPFLDWKSHIRRIFCMWMLEFSELPCLYSSQICLALPPSLCLCLSVCLLLSLSLPLSPSPLSLHLSFLSKENKHGKFNLVNEFIKMQGRHRHMNENSNSPSAQMSASQRSQWKERWQFL